MNTKTVQDTTPADVVNHQMIVALYHQYQADHITAIRAASKVQRELSRAEHEATRIGHHVKKIAAFCQQHNINLEEK